jgi:hypothetical protein
MKQGALDVRQPIDSGPHKAEASKQCFLWVLITVKELFRQALSMGLCQDVAEQLLKLDSQ